MDINDVRLTIERTGIRKEGENDLTFLHPATIIGEMVTFDIRSVTVVVARRRQVRFSLPFAPAPGAVHMVVIDRKTHFEPDFHVEGDQLFWDAAPLAVGTAIRFETYGGADTLGHLRLERVILDSDDAELIRLDGKPLGGRAEVYRNGLCYPETTRSFRVEDNLVRWRHPTVKLKKEDRLYVLYARTTEGATLFQQESLPLVPGLGREFGLKIEPKPPGHTRCYRRGLRYFSGVDFVTSQAKLTALAPIGMEHGDLLSVMSTASEGFFPKISDQIDLVRPFFVKGSTGVTESGDTSLSLEIVPPYPENALLSVRGSMYLQGKGFTRSLSGVEWSDSWLPLKAGDDLSMLGFYDERVGAAVRFKELPMAPGYPTWDLGEKAADIRKSLFLLSSADTYGGMLFVGERWLTFVDERTVRWSGPYPLKANDVAIIGIWKDPLVAAELKIHSHVVSMIEDGKPFTHRLPVRPKEPYAVLAGLNGHRLTSPGEFIMNDGVFNYLKADTPVKVGDEFVFLYR